MTARVRAAALTGFADVARELGCDPDALLRQAGLGVQSLRMPDQLIDATSALVRAAYLTNYATVAMAAELHPGRGCFSMPV